MKNEWLTPIHEGGFQMHLRIRPGDIPGYVLAPGDPGRVPIIGRYWDQYCEVQQNREYRIAKGQYQGVELAACSTGIGGPSTEIAVIELANVGVHTIIRVGTCAALQEEIAPGDLVIHTGAVRLSGAADMYVPKAYPAVAHYEIVLALIEAAENLGYPYHVGITASVDSFYAGEVNPLPNDKWFSHMNNIIPDLKNARVLTFEMEAATLFVLANIFGLRAGSVCVVASNRITRQRRETESNILRVCQVATHAIAFLSAWDKQKQQNLKSYWFPSLPRRGEC